MDIIFVCFMYERFGWFGIVFSIILNTKFTTNRSY